MRKPITSIECDIWMGNDLITAPPDHYRRSPDPREKGLPLSLTQMACEFYDPDMFADLGPDGDGTDRWDALHDFEDDPSVHRQNPADYFVNHGSTDGIWSLPLRGRPANGKPNGESKLPPGLPLSDLEIIEVVECEPEEHYDRDTVFFTTLRPDAKGPRIHVVTADHKVRVRPKGDRADLRNRLNAVAEELEAMGFRVVVQ